MPSQFVGLKDAQWNDLTDARRWLASMAPHLEARRDLGEIPIEALRFVDCGVDVEEDSLYWHASLRQEDAEDALLRAKKIPWTLNPEQDPATLAALTEFRAKIAPIKQRILAYCQELMNLSRGAPKHVQGVGIGNGEDSDISTRVSVSLFCQYGRIECPRCKRSVDLDRENRTSDGWYMCPTGCKTFFVEDATVGLALPEGIHHAQPNGAISRDALAQIFLLGHDDNRSFLTQSPLTDWEDGELRVYVAVKEAAIVGYATWNSDYDDLPVLRQLWVREGYRRQGIGTGLLNTEAADAEAFGVESPNSDGWAVIEAAGLAAKAFPVQGL